MAESDMCSEGEALISTDEFHALFREESERLSGFVPTLKGEQLHPMLITVLDRKAGTDKREMGLFAITSFPEGDEKRKVLFGVGTQAAGKGLRVVAAFLATEAWAKIMSPAEGWRAKRHGVPQPSRCPDRQEVVVLSGRTLDGRLALGMSPLEREGRKARLGEWKLSDPTDGIEDNLLKFFFGGYLRGFAKGLKDARE